MSTELNGCVRQFKVGDLVKKKGWLRAMKVIQYRAKRQFSAYRKMTPDQCICEWLDEHNQQQIDVFDAQHLEYA